MNKVTVIIPCFNNAKTLERAVKSVLLQTKQPDKIIIIDDKSNDGSRELIESLKSISPPHLIQTIFLEKNEGAANARNIGWDTSETEFIAFLDADDTWHKNKLEIQLKFMNEHPHVDLTAHAMTLHENQYFYLDKPIEFIPIKKKCLLFSNKFPTPSVILKRNIPFRFNKNQRYSEDYLLWLEIIFNNYNCFYSTSTLANVHKPFYGCSGLSSNMHLMQKNEIQNYIFLFSKNLITPPQLITSVIYSYIKYFRRLALLRIKNVFNFKK